MDDKDLTNRDYWNSLADAADLTIEGQRLIAEEIVFEAGLLWRAMTGWLRTAASGFHRGATG